MKVCNLSSGSKGNCTCISSQNTTILIDQGLTLRELSKRATEREINLSKLSAIIITHEHIDHIKGAEQLARFYNIPLFIHNQSATKLGLQNLVEQIDMDSDFVVGDLAISPFRLPHDSAYNLGYRISDGNRCMSIATDLGIASANIISKLCNTDMTIIEANHDVSMLLKGRYPYHLKQRILSANGHLSNTECSQVARDIAHSGTKKIMLAHLSEDNNTPELAFQSVCDGLKKVNIIEGKDIALDIAQQRIPSRWIKL